MAESAAPRRTWPVVAAFMTVSAIWGSTFLAIRVGNDALPPVWAATLRLAIAGALMTLIVALQRQPFPTGRARWVALRYGAFNFGVNLSLLYWGETAVPSGIAAVLYAAAPLCTALIARALGVEAIVPGKIGGAILALFGVGVLFSSQGFGTVTLLPTLAVFTSVLIASFGTVLLKRAPRQPVLPLNAVAALTGAVVCLGVSFVAREPHPIPTHAAQILPVLYLAIAGSIGAFVIFSWMVYRLEVSTASFIAVIVPVVALTLGAVVRHEHLTPRSLLGCILILGGVLAAIVSDRHAARGRTSTLAPGESRH